VLSLTGSEMASQAKYDYWFKLILRGDANVGKTALYDRYCDGIFDSPSVCGIGCDFKSRTIEVDGKRIKLYIVCSFSFSIAICC